MKKLIIILAAIAMVGAFTATSMAAEWNFYGSSRFATFRTDNSVGPADAQADDQDTQWAQAVNSRIGANVKLNDQIGGRFEMSESFGKRILYGTYNWGGGEVLIGQTYTPSTSFYSNSVYGADGDLLGIGQFYTGRRNMIQLKMAGFKLALIQPNIVKKFFKEDETIDTVTDDIDENIPKIEGSYKFKGDNFFLDVYAGYQTYTIDTPGKDYDVDSYVVGGGGGVDFGPGFARAGVHYGTNLGNYGNSGFLGPHNSAGATETLLSAPYGGAGYNSVKDEIVDNDGFGYLAVLGFKASDMFVLEAGYGYEEYSPDFDGYDNTNATQYYVNCTINIAPGVFIVPEFGKVEYEGNDVDLGDFTYWGAKWQINF